MEWNEALLAIVGGFLLLVVLGVPINFALGLSFMPILFIFSTEPPNYVFDLFALITYRHMTGVVLVAVPLFILMGQVLGVTGIGYRMYDGLQRWLGWLKGGLAITTVLTNTVIAAIVGASMISAATTGPFTIPSMVRHGYNKHLAIGAECSGSALAMLIPPSIPMVMYCVVTESSVGHLFMAGIIPGLVLAASFIVLILIRVTLNPSLAPPAPKSSWRKRRESIPSIGAPLLLIMLIMGSLYAGIAGVNEIAGLGTAGAFVLAFAWRDMNRAKFSQILLRTTRLTGFFALLLVCARFMGFGFTYYGISAKFVDWVTGLPVPGVVVIILLMCMYLLLGMLMNASAVILATMPFVLPVILALGYDPIWFGVLLIVNLEMGAITPPVGVNLFTLKAAVPGVEMWDAVIGSIPYMLLMLGMLGLLILFPNLALWLPSTMW